MKRAKPFLQAAALVSSVLLVGMFISASMGAFHPFGNTEPQSALQSPATPPNAAPQSSTASAVTQPTTENTPPTFMPGSKSINLKGVTLGLTPAGTYAPDLDVPIRDVPPANLPKLTLPVWLLPAPSPAPEPPPVFMSGSKSFRPVPFPQPTTPQP